jgi:hypothetical protein
MSTDPIPIECALKDLRRQPNPDIPATARQYSVNYTTLRRRFLGLQQSYQESRSESIQRLTNIQEIILIDFINRLIEHSLPPTSQIVKNVVEELSNRSVGKN